MVEHGKDKALDHIPKSSIAFIGRISNVQRGISSVTMPPRDHYKLQFDHKDLRTLRGRVYDTMIDFEYSQVNFYFSANHHCDLVFLPYSLAKGFFRQVMISIMVFAKLRLKFPPLVVCTSFV